MLDFCVRKWYNEVLVQSCQYFSTTNHHFRVIKLLATVWVLFVLANVNGKPEVLTLPMKDKLTCESAKAEMTTVLIKNNITEASLVCFEAAPGKLI